jgi:hypothetical protein
MQRVVVGPGAAGKSTLAARLSQLTGLPVIELDKLFWQPGLVATAPGTWAAIERDLVTQESWIMDGDLGPHDGSLNVRRLLAMAADLPPPQPPAGPAGDCDTRARRGPLRTVRSACGPAVPRAGDQGCAALAMIGPHRADL